MAVIVIPFLHTSNLHLPSSLQQQVALRKVAEFMAGEPGMVSALKAAFKEVDPNATGKV